MEVPARALRLELMHSRRISVCSNLPRGSSSSGTYDVCSTLFTCATCKHHHIYQEPCTRLAYTILADMHRCQEGMHWKMMVCRQMQKNCLEQEHGME